MLTKRYSWDSDDIYSHYVFLDPLGRGAFTVFSQANLQAQAALIWDGINGLSSFFLYRHNLPWSPSALSQSSRMTDTLLKATSWEELCLCIFFLAEALVSMSCVSVYDHSCTCVIFWLRTVHSMSEAQDPPNQAWHHTRGLLCYPKLISTFSSNLHLPSNRLIGGQTLAPINSRWWQIASRAVPSLLFPTQNLHRLRWNWPRWKRSTRVILGLTWFTTTLSKTHRHCGNRPTIHWDSDNITAVHVINIHVNAFICIWIYMHTRRQWGGLNKFRMTGSLKTHFHKRSGDFWWALVIVLDIILKCIHIARIIMLGNT